MTAQNVRPETRVKVIVFDLDDTLVDTFNQLIEPLERQAAHEMIAAGIAASNFDRIVQIILQARKDQPDKIEEILRREFPQAEKAIEARRAVFANASPDKLTIEPEVKRMLQELRGLYEIYLVSTGPLEFQNRKINQLGIGDLFLKAEVLESGSELTKEKWLARLAQKHQYDKASMVVVGNRLDNEIQAGNRLGMITVWVKRGEGSGVTPCKETGEPDYVISDIKDFPGLLPELESSRVHQ
jgi:FMN phosphatase YigB (HAD superfamily)